MEPSNSPGCERNSPGEFGTGRTFHISGLS